MKIIISAFIISILLHLIIFESYKNKELIKKDEFQETAKKKSEVKFVRLNKQEIVAKEEIIEKKVEPIIEKPKEIIKNENIKKIDKTKIKKDIANIEKSKKLQNNILKEQNVDEDKSLQNTTLENYLAQKEFVSKEILDELEKLYGKEYETFTNIQKAFLEKNLNNFQVITQKVLNRLGYPRLAAKLRISGTNVIEFMFHPDGSISDLKITTSSGYEIFDKYSKELIEIAYKDYPKPKTSTKIRFNVQYSAY
uniref:energy transducer TonB n=1 Tax=Aliarcobacter sp. TaxID=2321116 RepID=UPI0040488571